MEMKYYCIFPPIKPENIEIKTVSLRELFAPDFSEFKGLPSNLRGHKIPDCCFPEIKKFAKKALEILVLPKEKRETVTPVVNTTPASESTTTPVAAADITQQTENIGKKPKRKYTRMLPELRESKRTYRKIYRRQSRYH